MTSTMDKPIITEKHERTAHMLIRSPELYQMIRDAACEKCGIPFSDAVRVKITFEPENADGRNNYRARVTVTEDQKRLPQAETPQ